MHVEMRPDKDELPPEYKKRQWEVEFMVEGKSVPR